MGCSPERRPVRRSDTRRAQSELARQSERRPFCERPVAPPAGVGEPVVRRWRSSNCWLGRPYGPPIAFVIHTETGGESGTVAEFFSSSSQLSTHYAIGLDGRIDCFVDPDNRAWSNGILEPGNLWTAIAQDCHVDPALNPNHVTVTCETQDGGEANHDVSDDQYNAVLYAAWDAMQRYPTSLRYLARHADISPQSRPGCPGDRWLESGRFEALAERLGLKTTLSTSAFAVAGSAVGW